MTNITCMWEGRDNNTTFWPQESCPDGKEQCHCLEDISEWQYCPYCGKPLLLWRKEIAVSPNLPIVCLSGSTKFKTEFQFMAAWYEKRGYIVLTTHVFTHADDLPITDEEVFMHEDRYRQQIEMCDLLFVIDRDNYIGQSTSKEIDYACKLGKDVKYFSNIDFEELS